MGRISLQTDIKAFIYFLFSLDQPSVSAQHHPGSCHQTAEQQLHRGLKSQVGLNLIIIGLYRMQVLLNDLVFARQRSYDYAPSLKKERRL